MYQGLGQMLTMCIQHHQGCSETPKCAYVIYGQPLNNCEIPYSFRVVIWMVGEFLDLENLLFLLRLSNDLHSGVELSTHYHQVLRLCQGVDGTASAKRAFIITSLQ